MLSRSRNAPLFVTPWTVARQAPLSIGFSRQEHWSGLPCPPPGDLPEHGIQSVSLALAGGFFTTSTTWEAPHQAGVMRQKPISFLSKAAHLSLTEGRSLTLRNPFLLTGPNGKPSLSASFPSCFSEPGLCQLRRGPIFSPLQVCGRDRRKASHGEAGPGLHTQPDPVSVTEREKASHPSPPRALFAKRNRDTHVEKKRMDTARGWEAL